MHYLTLIYIFIIINTFTPNLTEFTFRGTENSYLIKPASFYAPFLMSMFSQCSSKTIYFILMGEADSV